MTRALLLGVLALAPAGCGTTVNMHTWGPLLGAQEPGPSTPEMYGGVAMSAEWARSNLEREGGRAKLLAAVGACDVVLSAVGDTLTLPLTAAIELWHPRADRRRRSSGVVPADTDPTTNGGGGAGRGEAGAEG
jgi:uncharacterized protein YceK